MGIILYKHFAMICNDEISVDYYNKEFRKRGFVIWLGFQGVCCKKKKKIRRLKRTKYMIINPISGHMY